MLVGISKV